MPRRQTEGQYSFGDYSIPRVEVRLRLAEAGTLYSTEPIDSARRGALLMQDVLKDLAAEHVAAVVLDNRMKPVHVCILSIGDVNQSLVPLRYTFASAILSNAGGGIMLLHNHPSGDPSPSEIDKQLTRRFIEAGKLMQIPIIDHDIVAARTGEIFSFLEHDTAMFAGDYDPEYIRGMLPGDNLAFAETMDTAAELTVHGRSR